MRNLLLAEFERKIDSELRGHFSKTKEYVRSKMNANEKAVDR